MFRAGWRVRPFDFVQFEELYDLRIVLESTAVRRLCETETRPELEPLRRTWTGPADERETEMRVVATLDEAFHATLVASAGNREMSRVHAEVTERIRIIRRLDFLSDSRLDTTYEEHGKLLRAILARREADAAMLLRAHVESSKAEIRHITLHKLAQAQVVREPAASAGAR
jgi:DNA-binding GntR family transcriptional regulator